MRSNGFKVRVSVTDNRRSTTRWPETWGSSPQRAVPELIGNMDVGARPGVFSAFHRAVRTLLALVLGSLPSPVRFMSSVLLYLILYVCCFTPSFSWSVSSHHPLRKSNGRRMSCGRAVYSFSLHRSSLVIAGHRRSSPICERRTAGHVHTL